MAAITTQVVRDTATFGALSCVILGLDSDARNMELLTTEMEETHVKVRLI
jgi:hypothetical protein